MVKKRCPICTEQLSKVIYLGFPMLLCNHYDCYTILGFWSFIINLFPITTESENEGPSWKFMVYEGCYLKALWYWLFNSPE